MKIAGRSFTEPNREVCVIPRGNADDIVFVAQAVLSYDEFELMCPPPKAPMLMKPGKQIVEDLTDPAYLDALNKRSELKLNWIMLKSLEATPELEWSTIDMANPKTWLNLKKELRDAFFTESEINRIFAAVFSANCVNEARIAEARANFHRGQEAAKAGLSGQNTQQPSSPSGEPVNA